MLRKKLLLLITTLFMCVTSFSQSDYYDEVGIMVGPAFFKSDYGERGDFENFVNNNGFSVGVFYYLSFIENYDNLKENFKLRLDLGYMKCNLEHYGRWVDASHTSTFANQLRAMKGSTKTINFGAEMEYYPFKTDDYNRGALFSPYISLGSQLGSYTSKVYSELGPLGTPETTPEKYMGAYRNDSKLVCSLTSSIGTRYKLSEYHSLIFDARIQYYFSDWVDGLNPYRKVYTENKTNDYLLTLNFGYVYYFN